MEAFVAGSFLRKRMTVLLAGLLAVALMAGLLYSQNRRLARTQLVLDQIWINELTTAMADITRIQDQLNTWQDQDLVPDADIIQVQSDIGLVSKVFNNDVYDMGKVYPNDRILAAKTFVNDFLMGGNETLWTWLNMRRGGSGSQWQLSSEDRALLSGYVQDFDQIQSIIKKNFPAWEKVGWKDSAFQGTQFYIRDFGAQWRGLFAELENWTTQNEKSPSRASLVS